MDSVGANNIITVIPFFRFTYIDVGAQGRASDGGVFAASSLQQAIERNALHLPPARCPPNGTKPLPYVILGDEGFQLRTYVMRPYPKRILNHQRRVCT